VLDGRRKKLLKTL
jgi:hypothetical protein